MVSRGESVNVGFWQVVQLFVVYLVPATGSRSPGLPVPAVERDWLMRDCSQYCLFQFVLIGIVTYLVAVVSVVCFLVCC